MKGAIVELEKSLAGARRRVRGAMVRGALARGLSRGAAVLLASAIGAALAVPVWGMAGTEAAWAVWVALCAAGVVGAAVCVIAAVVRTRGASWEEVAERVDLALGNHNRIATAYDLARRGAGSVFAAGAIQEGVGAARSAGDGKVMLPEVTWGGRRVAGMVAVAVVLYGVAAWGTRWVGGEGVRGVVEEIPAVGGVGKEAPASRPTSRPAAVRGEEATARRDGRAGAATRLPALGRSEGEARAESGAGDGMAAAVSNAKGAKSDAGRSAVGEEKEVAQGKSGEGREAGAAGGGASRGASGQSGERSESSGRGGGQSAEGPAVEGNDLTRSAVARPEQQGVEGGEEVAAAAQDAGSEYNAGAAPLRQDRGQAVSRELGQSGTDGGGGSGRGGPGEGKKARGAGAVFLSVPMPDFVPGKMSPGANRVEQKMIPPQPREEGERPGAAEVAERSVDEGVIRRFDPSPEGAAAVARYFEELHRRTAPADATGKGASSN